MTLAEFHTQVQNELKRGTSQNALIPAWTKRAARWIERNYTLQYMRRFVSFSTDPDAAEPRALPLPETRMKQIDFMRIVSDAGEALDDYAYLSKCDPQDVLGALEKQPTRYWLDAYDYIWLDYTPDVIYGMEMSYSRYTTWPTDTSETPWLVDNAEDALLARTMLYAAPAVRMSAAMKADYREMLQDGLQTLIGADRDLAETNTSRVMNYGRLT